MSDKVEIVNESGWKYVMRTAVVLGLMYLWWNGKLGLWWLVLFLIF